MVWDHKVVGIKDISLSELDPNLSSSQVHHCTCCGKEPHHKDQMMIEGCFHAKLKLKDETATQQLYVLKDLKTEASCHHTKL